jgi:RsiW-degrading membrane proteinase PrsW (M82 family)
VPAQSGPPSAAAPAAAGTELQLSLGGQSHTLRAGQEARIGRAPDNDVVVNDPTVSRQHAMVRQGAAGWEYVKVGSAPTFADGNEITQVSLSQPVDLALGSPDGPLLRLAPATGAAQANPAQGNPAQGAPAQGPDPRWRLTGELPPSGWPARPGWNPPYTPEPAVASGEDLASMLRILFPVHNWTHNRGWHGLRLAVIAYALLPLIFLTVLSSSSDLSTPGWAYSIYVAPLWLAGFWMLIRPPTLPGKQEIIIAVAIVAWTLIWINLVTININDALSTGGGISLPDAIVIGINEETTKALPVLLAGLILLKVRNVKLDVRMWMVLGTVAGLTFGIAEQAFYTSADIVFINMAHSPSQAVQAILAFAERVFVDGFQHAVWAGISGFFMGLAVNYHRRRLPLIAIGIGTPALLHALNDWLAGTSAWLVIIIQGASLLLFLSYTMTAAQIERKVRETPAFRGESIIMEAFRPDQYRPQ